MCCFLFALTYFNSLISDLSNFYLFYTLFFLIETFVVFFYVQKHKKLTDIFFYIFAIAILALAADVSTFRSQGVYAVTFYVFLIIIPMLHVGKPIYAIILSLCACLGFCLLTNYVKSATPQIAANDTLNAICCCIVGIGLDVTIINLQLENLQTKSHLEQLSAIDELTSLPNRRSLNLYIDEIFNNQCDNINIAMMDIDNFKSYNDHFGHLQGDECLRQVGALLSAAAEKHKLFISRFGGEEFVAIDTNHSIAEFEALCDCLLKNVEGLNIAHKHSPFGKVTISIGYSNLHDTGAKNYMELLDFADDALYSSKTLGKNRSTRYEGIVYRD
ncbi:MAG: GGDEF domain-containing protein [Oscillospiraceae bacterium]